MKPGHLVKEVQYFRSVCQIHTMETWTYLRTYSILRRTDEKVKRQYLKLSVLCHCDLQDNEPKHAICIVWLWLLCNIPDVLVATLKSPGFYPIEHVWGILQQQINIY